MSEGPVLQRDTDVPFDAFIDALKTSLIEARQRIRDHHESVLAASLAALDRRDAVGEGCLLARMEDDDRLYVPHQCFARAIYLQVTELAVEMPMQVPENNPTVIELLNRRQARRTRCARLRIRLTADDKIAGTVMINDKVLKDF